MRPFLPEPLSERDTLMISPLRLAYIGDAVHDLFVRTNLLLGGSARAGAMHREAARTVNAAAQAQALARVLPMLSETEQDVVRRGRNAHAHHGVPRRANAADYKQATGLEALLGFLYLTGQAERLAELMAVIESKEDADAER